MLVNSVKLSTDSQAQAIMMSRRKSNTASIYEGDFDRHTTDRDSRKMKSKNVLIDDLRKPKHISRN